MPWEALWAISSALSSKAAWQIEQVGGLGGMTVCQKVRRSERASNKMKEFNSTAGTPHPVHYLFNHLSDSIENLCLNFFFYFFLFFSSFSGRARGSERSASGAVAVSPDREQDGDLNPINIG